MSPRTVVVLALAHACHQKGVNPLATIGAYIALRGDLVTVIPADSLDTVDVSDAVVTDITEDAAELAHVIWKMLAHIEELKS